MVATHIGKMDSIWNLKYCQYLLFFAIVAFAEISQMINNIILLSVLQSQVFVLSLDQIYPICYHDYLQEGR